MKKQKIYLAGPDVFLQNAIEIGNKKKEICSKYGFEGCFPFDNEIKGDGKSLPEIGLLISKANETLIKNCDIIVANLTPFRSPSADVGTVYEIGFAKANGLICYGYSNTIKLFTERVKQFYNIDSDTDLNNMNIENFGMVDNLMIDGGVFASGGIIIRKDIHNNIYTDLSAFEECISSIACWQKNI